MRFESGFEGVDRVSVTEVWGKRVPERRGTAAESSAPHGAEAGGGSDV